MAAPAPSAMSTASSAKGGCGGDRCASGRDAWPLHHFRHEGVFCLLCSSCVLLYSPSAFCAACLHLLSTAPAAATAAPGDPAVAAPGPTKPCSACAVSVAHLSCAPADHPFVCPPCAAAAEGRAFSFAPAPGRRPLQERDARVLLVAARLSHESVSRAAATARQEAERRVVEAAEARKRSREMLDTAVRALEAEAREAKMRSAAAAAQPPPPPPAPKKKPEAAQPPPPKKKPEANKDRDKLLKLNAMQQPALAFAAAAAAAAAATSVPLPTPSSREEKKPVVKQEAQGSAPPPPPPPPPREDQGRPPLFGTLQS